jgi:hypothetical protein
VHSDTGAECISSSDDESEEEDGCRVECEKDLFEDLFDFGGESSDEETIAEPVQFKDSPIAVPLNYVTGGYGQGRLVRPHDTDVLYSIPYPVFYRYRGKALKNMNRLEYYSLVQINRRGKESGADGSEGRKKSKEFPFGHGLDERIGGPGPGRYFQYLRSKQCTPQFFSSQARHPGREPSDPEEQKAWRMKADKFACDFLIMFRPEPDLYEEGQSCTYEYNWEASLEFFQELQSSDKCIDRSRLEQMERIVHSWGVDEAKKKILSEWRGRSRTLWSAEDKELAGSEYAKYKRGKFGHDGDGEIDYDGVGVASGPLTLRQTNDASKMISHSRELLAELRRLDGAPRDKEHAAPGPSEPVRTIHYDEDFAKKLAKLQPDDDEEETNAGTDGRPLDRHSDLLNREAKVEACLEKEDLSSDKTPVINEIRQYFRAICDGSSKDKKYNAPLLLVCGGPGNGKSKLVKTVDGISHLMGVGTQVKTAYLGVAAVNIGGSSLCSLFDIPTERRKGKDGVDFKKIILPWSDEKKRKFMKMYDIDKISCIVVDEISTVQPYVLAYLSARLMELLQSDKDFGGVAVMLYGDFDQLPPVAGDNLAKATMKYEEQQDSSADINRWDRSKHCVNVHNEGLRLFQKFLYFQLTKQHRSKDPIHTEIINNMRRSGKVKMEDLKKCQLLSEEDVAGNGDFRFATTLVTGNQERHQIINHKAKDWASHHGTFLVRWLRNVDYRKWEGKPRAEEHIKHAMANNETFFELFVPGALGYLNHNINTSKGIPLANGTEIKYDSISFEDPEHEAEFRKHVRAHSPGATITLHKPPSAINVELFADWPGDSEEKKKENEAERRQWQHGSLVRDGSRIVIPISTKYRTFNDWEKTYIPPAYSTSRCKTSGLMRNGLRLYGVSTVLLQDHFCIEPGFCITLHKAQGRTIRRLILSISDHPYYKLRHKWEGLYVGVSRVEYNEHMRLLLKRGDWGTTKLLRDLERCKHAECFFKGYVQLPNENGMRWNRRLARDAAEDANLFKKKKKSKTKKKS